MSVYKRKDSPYWSISISVKGRRFRESTPATTRQEALSIEAIRRKELIGEEYLHKKRELTIDETFGKYWLEYASKLKSAKDVSKQITRILDYYSRSALLSQIGNRELSELVYHFQKKGMQPANINRHLAVLRAAHNKARAVWGIEVKEVSFGLVWQQEPDSRTRYLTDAEAAKLLSECAPHLKHVVLFAIYTGIRKGNILSLKWQDVDLPNKQINIRVKSKRPGGKIHSVPIVDDLLEMLETIEPKVGPVFTFNGKPIKDVKSAWRRAVKDAGIADFRFHDLRHTNASWMLQSGADIMLLRDTLGHSDSRMTMKYAHHSSTARKVAMEKTFASRISHGNLKTKVKPKQRAALKKSVA